MLGNFKRTTPGAAIIDGERSDLPYRRLDVRAYDDETGMFYLANAKNAYFGVCFVSPPLAGADQSTVDKLRSSLSLPLPPGSFIQFGLLATPDIDDILEHYLRNKGRSGSPILAELSRRRAELLMSGTRTSFFKSSGVTVKRQRLIVSIKVPAAKDRKPSPEEMGTAQDVLARSREALTAAGLHLTALDDKQYVGLMRLINHVFAGYNTDVDQARPLREQIFFPADKVNYDNPRQIRFDDGVEPYFVRALSVKQFPARTNLALMNYMIGDPDGVVHQITEPFFLVTTLHYPDQIAKITAVRARYGWLEHQASAHVPFLRTLGFKKAGFDVLMRELDGQGAVLCELNITLFLMSKSEEKLSQTAAALCTYYSSLGLEMREDERILEPLWNTCLPLNPSLAAIEFLHRYHTMTLTQAVCFLPVIGEWADSGDGGMSLYVSRRGMPQLYSPFDAPSANAIVVAKTRSGKSFAMEGEMSDFLDEGGKAWVLDQGRSYQKLCAAVGGQFIEFSPTSNVCLNPFTHIEGDLSEEMDMLKAVIAKMACPEEVLDDYRMSLLERAITATYNKMGTKSTVSDVANFCIASHDVEAQRLGTQLFPFTRSGSYGRWFDGDANLSLTGDFVVMELQELSTRKALQQVVLLLLMSRIGYEIYHTNGRRKKVLIDEAATLIDDPIMAKGVGAMYRKVGKYGGSMTVVLQSIMDLGVNASGRVLKDNSEWLLILQQTTSSVDAAIEAKQLYLDPYGVKMLKSLRVVPGQFSEMMILRASTGEYGICRVVADRFTQVLFSTSGRERDDVLQAIESGTDPVLAVNNHIEQYG